MAYSVRIVWSLFHQPSVRQCISSRRRRCRCSTCWIEVQGDIPMIIIFGGRRMYGTAYDGPSCNRRQRRNLLPFLNCTHKEFTIGLSNGKSVFVSDQMHNRPPSNRAQGHEFSTNAFGRAVVNEPTGVAVHTFRERAAPPALHLLLRSANQK